jgi:GNAT superfamily N-acetyltransferase
MDRDFAGMLSFAMGTARLRADNTTFPGDLSIVTADSSHVDELVDVRIKFALDVHPISDRLEILELERRTREYILRGMSNGTYVGFLGMMGSRTVGAASLLIYTLPPMPGSPDRRQGHVLNVYTAPELRSRGIGRRMMEALIAEARRRGLFRLFLNATKMGEPLYRSLGFVAQEDEALVMPL